MFVGFDWGAALAQSPILIVLIGCSIVTLGFAIERLSYYRKRGGDPDATMRKALNAVEGNRFDEAINHLQDLAHPLGPVATHTLHGFRRAPAEAEEIMHVMLNQQKLLLERNTGLLGTMAAITPLIGLLGTVWGIMRAFQAMGAAGSSAPTIVAGGIAEALITTAAGLVIAVPAVMLYNHFNRRLATMLQVAENHTRLLCVAARRATGLSAPAPTAGTPATAPVRAARRAARETAAAVQA
ncbi:MotA/TolQ/ExbB proton channel family protein [bacterium]|nr:MotA/TolQ/ExbB proton channel family protein [bacterium]